MSSKPVTWSEIAVQKALANTFDWLRVLCVPNVMTGLCTESDFLVVTKAGILWECEIKVTMADWKNDLKKKRSYWPEYRPARFYYAVTDKLLAGGIPEWVSPQAGILKLYNDLNRPRCHMVRQAKAVHRQKVSDKTRMEILTKVYCRYWRHAAPQLDESVGRQLEPEVTP